MKVKISEIIDAAMRQATIRIKRNVLNLLLDELSKGSQDKFHNLLWPSGVPDAKLDHALLQCENTMRRILRDERERVDGESEED